MGSYSALWKARLRLMRAGNASMSAVGVWIGMAVVLDPWTSSGLEVATPFIAAGLAAFLIASFGNVLNDILDRDVDKAAHPDRPLVNGDLGLQDAKSWAALLVGLGLLYAWIAGGVPLLAFAIANTLGLVLYELWAKRHGLPGNALIGALVASTFLFGAVAVHGGAGIRPALPIAIMAGLATLARELIKDVEDAQADRGHRRTMAHVYPRGARFLASASLAGAIGYVLAVAVDNGWGVTPWTVLIVGILVFLAGLETSWHNPGRGQRLLKWGMVLMLVTFAIVHA